MSREIDRAGWRDICPRGPEPEDRVVSVRQGAVWIEAAEGLVDVMVSTAESGVEVRVGDVHLVVRGRRVTVAQGHPPYPMNRWTVLWEGETT